MNHPTLLRHPFEVPTLLNTTTQDDAVTPTHVRTLSIALMWFLGLINLGFLVWVILDPHPVAEYVGLSAAQPQAGSELRAMYGGLIGGLGVLNIIGARVPDRLIPAIWCTAWTFAGVGSVRSVSCIYLGIGGSQALFAASEVLASVTCFILLRALERAETRFV